MSLHSRLDRLVGDKMARRFVGTAGLSLALRVAWAILNYAGIVLLARWLAPESYGIFAIVMSVILPLSIFCGIGRPTALLRFLGQYEAEGKPGLARGLIVQSTRLVLLSALVATAVLIAGVWVLDGFGRISDPVAYTLGFLILPAYTLITVQSSVAREHGAVVSALAPRDVAWRALLIPIGYVAALQSGAAMQAVVLFTAAAVALVLIAAIQRARIAAITPTDVHEAAPEFDRDTWRETALPIWLTMSATTLGANIDVLAVGSILSEADTGRYFLIQRTATLASFVLVSINLVIGPEISKLYYAGEIGRLNRLLRIANLLVFLPSLAALAIFVFGGRWLLGFIGPQAAELHPELIVLGVGQVVNAATGCVGVVLNMTGAERTAAWFRVVFAILGTIATFVCAYLFGTMGAALAAAAALGGCNAAMALYARYRVGIDASVMALILTPKARQQPTV